MGEDDDIPYDIHIVVNGNLTGGFIHTGPFANYDAALKWAEDHVEDEWWVIELDPPTSKTEDAERRRLYEKYGDGRLRG
jgi:hypothetical protein